MSVTMKHGDASATGLKRVISRELAEGFIGNPTFSATEKSEAIRLRDFSLRFAELEMTEFW
jgi:hypothetical protein